MGIDIHEHGGIFGGSGSLRGKQSIKIFAQLTEPDPINVGDIWAKTDRTIGDVFFRDLDPSEARENDITVKIGNTTRLIVNIKDSMSFIGKTESEVTFESSNFNKLNLPSSDHLEIWKNPYMKMMVLIGALKIRNVDKWSYIKSYYWSGTEWKLFSYSDIYPMVASSIGVTKLNPEGEIVWGPKNEVRGQVVTLDEEYIYVGTVGGAVYKLNQEGVQIWSYLQPADGNTTSFVVGSINVHPNGSVYVSYYSNSTGASHLTKLTKDGLLSSVYKPEGYTAKCKLVDLDENVYTGHSDGKISKTKMNATKVWTYQGSDVPYSAMAMDRESNIVAGQEYNSFYTRGGTVQKISSVSGASVISNLSVKSATNISAVAVDGNGFIYASAGNTFRKFGPGNTLVWTKTEDSVITDIAVDPEGAVYTNSGVIKKYTADGILIWSKSTLGSGSVAAYPSCGLYPHKW